MKKEELDCKIADVAKTLLSYCVARTSNQFEADDLAQDIIVEIYKSIENLRDERAFYGFMWSIASNVYKNWCKNKQKDKVNELSENLFYNDDFSDNDDESLLLLRRELTLLAEKYRKSVILYYIENMSCSEKGKENYWLSQFGFGISNAENATGDYVQFMDFPINGEMVHHYCFNRQNVTNIFLDIAKGNSRNFSENDKAIAADMVRKGYVLSTESGLSVNAPVYTQEQYKKLKEFFAATAEQISCEAETLMDIVTEVMKNHIPLHLKKLAHNMAYLRLFEDAISAPVSVLCDEKYLLPYSGDGVLPTTYVILK